MKGIFGKGKFAAAFLMYSTPFVAAQGSGSGILEQTMAVFENQTPAALLILLVGVLIGFLIGGSGGKKQQGQQLKARDWFT